MADYNVQQAKECAKPLFEIWEDEGEEAIYHGVVEWSDLGPNARSILAGGVGERYQLAGPKYIVRVR